MKYVYNRKEFEVREQELFILIEHEKRPCGIAEIDNLMIETDESGTSSICVVNREVYGSGSIVVHASDILVARGKREMTLWMRDGSRLEGVPFSKETMIKLYQQFEPKMAA